jgi:hypothetical protein
MHGRKDKSLSLLMGVEEVTEIAQTTFSLDGTVEGFHHQSIRSLIEGELHPYVLRVLQSDQVSVVGDDTHHTVSIHIGDGPREREVMESVTGIVGITGNSGSTGYSPEEDHRSPELEVMLNILVLRAKDFNGELVQGIVITTSSLNRIPADATMNLPLAAHLLRLHTKLLLLGVVFHLQELTEPLQV